jgi:hypothetical protein
LGRIQVNGWGADSSKYPPDMPNDITSKTLRKFHRGTYSIFSFKDGGDCYGYNRSPNNKTESKSVVNIERSERFNLRDEPNQTWCWFFLFQFQSDLERRGLDLDLFGLMGYPPPKKISQLENWHYLKLVFSQPCLDFSLP